MSGITVRSEINNFDMLVITGPTASGKTALAAEVAFKLGGEIISADSRQVYRKMNIGTGKDYADYIVNGQKIPYHLIDVADPGYKYNVFEYQRDFISVLHEIRLRGAFPVVCGGSGLYIDSIVSGYRLFEVPPDPAFRSSLESKSLEELGDILSSYRKPHNITDLDTKKRAIRAIEIERYNKTHPQRQSDAPLARPLIAGVSFSRDTRRERITDRLRQRLENGMVDEVNTLLREGIDPEALIYYGLEYKYITLYLTGKLTWDEMYGSLETAIHQFAKRQMTWFRGMERRGIIIRWIDGELPMNEKVQGILTMLAEQQ
jgi:tRNA dimethylallyltransferase